MTPEEEILARERKKLQEKIEKQLDKAGGNLDSERKSRGRKEVVLVLVCVIGLIYFLPFIDFEESSQIEIPAISLKVPTKYISSAFPTIITAIYLIYLSSLISYLGHVFAYLVISRQLVSYLKTGSISEVELKDVDISLAYNSFFLPTPLIYIFKPELKFTKITRIIVQIYVGIIFNALPYLSVVLILMRVHKEIHNIPLLVWNIICIVVMFLSFIGIFCGFFISPKKVIKKIID